MQYSHRNGETEPPEISGWYWFTGEVNETHGGFKTEGQGETVLFDDEYGCIWFQGDNAGYYPSSCIGKWWGPLVPPWASNG